MVLFMSRVSCHTYVYITIYQEMREYQDRNRRKKLIYSPAVLVGFFIILIFLLISLWGIFKKSQEALRLRKENMQEKEEILSRKVSLEEEVDRLASDAGKEEAIRKRFSVKKPGEEVLVILPSKDKNDDSSNDSKSNFFVKIWQGVKKFFK